MGGGIDGRRGRGRGDWWKGGEKLKETRKKIHVYDIPRVPSVERLQSLCMLLSILPRFSFIFTEDRVLILYGSLSPRKNEIIIIIIMINNRVQ
jgi:hypothetical protein